MLKHWSCQVVKEKLESKKKEELVRTKKNKRTKKWSKKMKKRHIFKLKSQNAP